LFTEGKIGSFILTNNALSSTPLFGTPAFLISSSVDYLNLSTAFFISSSKFNVRQDGTISGSNVLFTGGKIAGFTISDNTLSNGSNFYISGSASGDQFFISSSKFNVKGNGDITASSALFNGNVTAVNISKKLIDVQNNNSGSYLRHISGNTVTGKKNLVFNGSLNNGNIAMAMSIGVSASFTINDIEAPNTGSSLDTAVTVYINTPGMTFDDGAIFRGSPFRNVGVQET